MTSVKRDRSLLRAARDEACQWCGRKDGTVVAAHSNQLIHGKGMGTKADDRYIAFLCFVCHSELDQGSWMTKAQRRQMWDEAHRKTVQLLIGKGLLEADDPCAGQAGAERPPQIRTGQDIHAEDDSGLRSEGG